MSTSPGHRVLSPSGQRQSPVSVRTHPLRSSYSLPNALLTIHPRYPRRLPPYPASTLHPGRQQVLHPRRLGRRQRRQRWPTRRLLGPQGKQHTEQLQAGQRVIRRQQQQVQGPGRGRARDALRVLDAGEPPRHRGSTAAARPEGDGVRRGRLRE